VRTVDYHRTLYRSGARLSGPCKTAGRYSRTLEEHCRTPQEDRRRQQDGREMLQDILTETQDSDVWILKFLVCISPWILTKDLCPQKYCNLQPAVSLHPQSSLCSATHCGLKTSTLYFWIIWSKLTDGTCTEYSLTNEIMACNRW